MFRKACIAALFVAFVLIVGPACSRSEGPKYSTPFQRFSILESRYYAAFPTMEKLRDELLTLIVNMDGMEGLLDLLDGATGIDLADEGLFDLAGVDGRFPPALFEYRGGLVVCLGLKDSGDFVGFVDELARGNGIEFVPVATDGPLLHVYESRLAWTVLGNLAVFLYRGGEGGAENLLASLLLTSPPENPMEQDAGLVHFSFRNSSDKLFEGAFHDDLPGLGSFSGLALAGLRYLDSCSRFDATIVPGDKYNFSISAHGCKLPFEGNGRLVPERLVPEDTVLLLHASFRADSLWELFPPPVKALLEFLWDDVPKKRRPAALADIGPFLDRFEPEVGLAFLGFSPAASIKSFASPSDAAAPLFGLHLQLILSLKQGAAVEEFFDEKEVARLLKKFEGTDLSTGKIRAKEYCREKKGTGKRCFSVVLDDRTFMLVTGIGEGGRLVRTLRGQTRALADTLFAGSGRGRGEGALVVTLKTRRLVRDLMNKGFPPYFLQVLSSILEVRFSADSRNGDTGVSCEVVLR